MFRLGWIQATVGLVALVAVCAACGYGDDEVGAQLEHGNLSFEESVAAVHVPCLDTNEDFVLTADDAAPLEGGGGAAVPDFNADGASDEADQAFLDAGLQLAPEFDHSVCEQDPTVEFLVGSDDVPAITCEGDTEGIVVVGVAGGIVDLRTQDNGAGVRWMVNALLDELADRDNTEAVALISGPGLPGIASGLNTAMEDWMTHTVRTYLDQFDCGRIVLLGHSHGAVTTDVIASRLEEEFADRIVVVVSIDRSTELYVGDTESRPVSVPVFNVFQTNSAEFPGEPYDSPNVENWDASGEEGPEEGEEGGPSVPVDHTNIDNSTAVRDRVLDEILERLD